MLSTATSPTNKQDSWRWIGGRLALKINIVVMVAGIFVCSQKMLTNMDTRTGGWEYEYTAIVTLPTQTANMGSCSAITRQLNLTRLIDPQRPYPFKGARNETGHYGYVHDPCILLQQPPPLQQVDEICNATPGNGEEGSAGQYVLDRISIFDGSRSPKRGPVLTTMRGDPAPTAPSSLRIFCSLYTYPGGNNLTDAIRETWGKDCHGFLAASSETVASRATVDISHFGQPNAYKSIWNRVQSTMVYIYDNFRFDFDYFYFCGDDTFLIVENLQHFLASESVKNATEMNQPFHAGGWIHTNTKPTHPPGFYYNGGGGVATSSIGPHWN